MPNQPLVLARVTITAKDINNNNIAKTFNTVRAVDIDFVDGTINIIDGTGSFYFPIKPLTTVTYTITPGVNGVHVIVAS